MIPDSYNFCLLFHRSRPQADYAIVTCIIDHSKFVNISLDVDTANDIQRMGRECSRCELIMDNKLQFGMSIIGVLVYHGCNCHCQVIPETI